MTWDLSVHRLHTPVVEWLFDCCAEDPWVKVMCAWSSSSSLLVAAIVDRMPLLRWWPVTFVDLHFVAVTLVQWWMLNVLWRDHLHSLAWSMRCPVSRSLDVNRANHSGKRPMAFSSWSLDQRKSFPHSHEPMPILTSRICRLCSLDEHQSIPRYTSTSIEDRHRQQFSQSKSEVMVIYSSVRRKVMSDQLKKLDDAKRESVCLRIAVTSFFGVLFVLYQIRCMQWECAERRSSRMIQLLSFHLRLSRSCGLWMLCVWSNLRGEASLRREILLWVRSMSCYLSLSKLVPEQERSSLVWLIVCGFSTTQE